MLSRLAGAPRLASSASNPPPRCARSRRRSCSRHPSWTGRVPPPRRGEARRGSRRLAGGGRVRGPGCPAELTNFVGRTSDVEALIAALGEARLVTVTGVGGIGKTRLALRVATMASSRFVDGVFWCELAPLADPASVAACPGDLARRTRRGGAHVPSTRSSRSSPTSRCSWSWTTVSIVLPGVRSMVTTLLSGCPDLVILATSRERLAHRR